MMNMPHEIAETRSTRTAWIVALLLTALVTLAGLVIVIQQFVVKYLIDNWAHTRTLPGLLCMLLGIVGVCLPVLLIAKRKKFLSLRTSRQWLAAFGIPFTYVLVFVSLGETSFRSTTMILPRADTPKAVVSYDNGKMNIEFRCRRGSPGPGGFNHIKTLDGVEHVSADYKSAHSPRRDYNTHVEIRGRSQRLEDNTIQIDLDVDADEPIRFEFEDLELIKVTRDGQAIDESDAMSGKFRVTVLARRLAIAWPS